MKPSTAPGEPCCRRCSRNFGRTTAWHWGGPPRNGWGSSMSSSCWGTSCWDGIMNEVVTKYILSLVNITHIISHIYSCGFLDIARVGVWLASVFTENRPTCKGETCFTLWGCLKLIASNKTDRNGSKWIYRSSIYQLQKVAGLYATRRCLPWSWGCLMLVGVRGGSWNPCAELECWNSIELWRLGISHPQKKQLYRKIPP